MRFKDGLGKAYRSVVRRPIDVRNRARLRNWSPSVISNNCNGAVMLHDLGLPFMSPTVNLFIPFPDYIRFLKGLDGYLSLPQDALVEIAGGDKGYPVGMLDDIELDFMHYKSFDEAKNKWFERAARVDRENLYVMLSQRDGCTRQDVERFGELPFRHKVALTAEPMPHVACSYFNPKFTAGGGASGCSATTCPSSQGAAISMTLTM